LARMRTSAASRRQPPFHELVGGRGLGPGGSDDRHRAAGPCVASDLTAFAPWSFLAARYGPRRLPWPSRSKEPVAEAWQPAR
jgi:hypothetical protein